ncbi:hypothetical protein BJ170DRAFT_733002 [Xylariales sp. AK1849]|nr:hypothetical protein BJ170DRAFT_733002 [Xylariales sp. AK1849]
MLPTPKATPGRCDQLQNPLIASNLQETLRPLRMAQFSSSPDSSTGSAAAVGLPRSDNLPLKIHRFNQLFPVPTFMRNGSPPDLLGSRLAEFFQTALTLATGRTSIKQNTLRRLGSDEGLERIKELTDIVIPAAITHEVRLRIWKSHLRPFFLVLSDYDNTSTSLERAYHAIRSFLVGTDRTRIISLSHFLDSLVSDWKISTDDDEETSKDEVLVLFSEVLSQLVESNPFDPSNETRAVIQRFQTLVLELNTSTHKAQQSQANQNLQRVIETLDNAATAPSPWAPTSNLPGGRHDNDHANIADIHILPTTAEVLSTTADYLPVYDSSRSHLSGLQGLLDRHFRLLRADNVGALRDVVRNYLESGQRDEARDIHHDHRVRTNTYSVQGIDVSAHWRDGFELQLKIKQPPEVASRSTATYREQWWSESKRLDWDALVCLVGNGKAMFCVVSRATIRSTTNLAEGKEKRIRKVDPYKTLYSQRDTAHIVVKPANLKPSDIDFILEVQSMEGTWSIVEFPTILLASFKPMLSTIQRMSRTSDVPLAEFLVGLSTQEVYIPPPAYAQPGFEFSLKSLIKGNQDLMYSPRAQPDVAGLCQRSNLDEAQASSLLNTLRRRIALIQGPPGTGKSYTGESIIEVLLANRFQARIGPIICVCQTNHALDQLLEHLLRKGIRSIIRVGSRTRSSLIEPLLLRNIMERTDRSNKEMKKSGMANKGKRKITNQILDALEDFQALGVATRFQVSKRIHQLVQEYDEYTKRCDQGWIDYKARILLNADIIGVTTTGLALFNDLLCQVRPKVILCEEAGEILEAHTLAALMPSIEHMILIGDHQQLRPQINNWALRAANPQGQEYSLDISLFERLLQPLLPSDKQLPFDTLQTQRRMHPSIANLVRSTFYPHLQDAGNVQGYPEVAGMRKRLYWFHHSKPEDYSGNDAAFTNRFEVEVVKTLLSYLVRQNIYMDGEITVLTPYTGQLRTLRLHLGASYDISMNDQDTSELEKYNMMSRVGAGRGANGRPRIRVATVDNFQGEEASVVIISLVRSNPSQNVGFLSQANRINVLLSRAKHGMYILGNAHTYTRNRMWSQIIEMMINGGNFGTSFELQCPRHKDMTIVASSATDFEAGGCSAKCDKLLKCGHTCTSACHSKIAHDTFRCQAICNRSSAHCGHFCPRRCGEPCEDRCSTILEGVTMSLPCGHNFENPRCWQKAARGNVPCNVECKAILPCGHRCGQLCHPGRACTPCNKTHATEGTDYVAVCDKEFENLFHNSTPLIHPKHSRATHQLLLNEALKNFVSSSHAHLVELEIGLLDEQDALEISEATETLIADVGRAGKLNVVGQPYLMIQVVHSWVGSRHDSIVRFMQQVNKYLAGVRAEEKHFGNACNPASDDLLSGELRLQCTLAGTMLLIRCVLAILCDYLYLRQQAKQANKLQTTVELDLSDLMRLCEWILEMSRERMYPRLEVEACVLMGRMVVMTREVYSFTEDSPKDDMPKVLAKKYLDRGVDIVFACPSLIYLVEDIDAVNGQLNRSKYSKDVSAETKRGIWLSYTDQFIMSHDWYTCANGHPFSISTGKSPPGAFCPECDAPISGLDAVEVDEVGQEQVDLVDDEIDISDGLDEDGKDDDGDDNVQRTDINFLVNL